MSRCLYALRDPISGIRFYIGQMRWPTRYPLRRHLYAARIGTRGQAHDRIRLLLQIGERPIFEALVFSSDDDQIIELKANFVRQNRRFQTVRSRPYRKVT